MNVKGLFITFEGPDGSGKSTQIKYLKQYIESQNLSYILTREPGGTTISDAIRTVLLNPDHTSLTNETEILLYAASRAQHVEECIKPALEAGKIVICDRFVDASVAYQGYGLGVPVTRIKEINAFAAKGLIPDRTYLIDISPEEGRKRMEARDDREYGMSLDRIEQRKLEYHKRVREGFHHIYREDSNRICLVNGHQPSDMIFEEIRTDFQKYIQSYKKI